MTEKPADYGREVRDTVVKSGLTGVAATVLAVTFFSPAGFGGMIGTSLASGFGLDTTNATADDPYASLPPYPAPLTAQELSDIHNRLAQTTASLEITRAATEAKIEHIRSLAVSGDLVTFTPTRHAQADGLRLRTSEPQIAAAPAPLTPVVSTTLPALEVTATPISFAGGVDPSYRDPHLELADLLLADETF
ncbi:MAG TPA: hypothetical protein VFO00_12845 [Vitreimonas sp.]|nr:hypothetical protein [Vitreimonas sp.]